MSSTDQQLGLESHLPGWARRLLQTQPSYHHSPLSQGSSNNDDIVDHDDELIEKSMSSSQLLQYGRVHPKPHRLSSSCLFLLTILLSALISTSLTIAVSRFDNGQSQASTGKSDIEQADLIAPFRPTPRLRHCGTDAEQARALGCKFQIWSYSWVPPECFDEKLVNEWLEMRDWEYYDDRGTRGNVVNFTTTVLQGEGDQTLYSTWGQHYWHCAFTWRKFLRASLGSGVGITDQDLDYHHADHCQDTIRNKPDYRPWDENDIELVVGFHRC